MLATSSRTKNVVYAHHKAKRSTMENEGYHTTKGERERKEKSDRAIGFRVQGIRTKVQKKEEKEEEKGVHTVQWYSRANGIHRMPFSLRQ